MSYVVIDVAEPKFGIQVGKRRLKVHDPQKCAGQACSVHNPSAHHMKEWPLNWRMDRALMERLCPHGIGHPDPDHMAYVSRGKGKQYAKYEGVHGCDGCCATPKRKRGACKNCDGVKCMGCVLREVHDSCQDDCPECCNIPLF